MECDKCDACAIVINAGKGIKYRETPGCQS